MGGLSREADRSRMIWMAVSEKSCQTNLLCPSSCAVLGIEMCRCLQHGRSLIEFDR